MSNVTLAYNAARTALAALYPDKNEIPNPYSMEDNNTMLLRDSWGLKAGPTSVSPFEVLKETAAEYDFIVVLSTEIVRKDSDVEAVHTRIKALLEDGLLVRKDFLNSDQLSAQAYIRKIEWNNTSDILEAVVGKFNHRYIEVSFSFDIAEDI